MTKKDYNASNKPIFYIHMKKLFYLLLAVTTLFCASCGRDDEPWEDEPITPEQTIRDMVTNETYKNLTIRRMHNIKMRRALVYPFQVYVMQMSNGGWYYLLRYKFNQDLHVGDVISFSTYTFSPNEISSINGIDLGDGSDSGGSNSETSGGEYWVVSDPIEATVKDLFSMKVIYGVPFLAFDSQFIETTDGNLLYIKKLKLGVTLRPGDRIVYDVYTWAPNEIVAIKKL